MPVNFVVITEVETQLQMGEPVLVLHYRLPDDRVGAHSKDNSKNANEDPDYGGHTHQVAVHTIYSRMCLYETDKIGAIEDIIAENLFQHEDETYWPSPAERAAQKTKYKIKITGSVKQAIEDLVEDPSLDHIKHHRRIIAKALHEERVVKMRGSGYHPEEKKFKDWVASGRKHEKDPDGALRKAEQEEHINMAKFKPKHIKGKIKTP
jgi:hypothetical protein